MDSIDLLRGLVMVLMALDHVRDFVAPSVPPEQAPEMGLSWFMTRWVTHFCAPVFVFLAGVSAWLYGSRGRSRGQLSRFLLTRGLWLLLLEVTWVSASRTFTSFPSTVIILQVIFAIGASMILLSGLVWMPRGTILLLGVAILVAHNLMDGTAIDLRAQAGIAPQDYRTGDVLYSLLRSGLGYTTLGGYGVVFQYPILPWAALLFLGYSFGPRIGDPDTRARSCTRLGFAMVTGFVVLRLVGMYGDTRWFQVTGDFAQTFISFLNTQKYPPSLQYSLMTIGPALLLLGWLSRRPTLRGTGWLVTFGRVPLFYYLLHLPLANAAGAIWFQLAYGLDRWVFALSNPMPPEYEPLLLPVYAIWIAVIAILYPVCARYARFRRTARGWWWSYL